jgi:hypothetical protein
LQNKCNEEQLCEPVLVYTWFNTFVWTILFDTEYSGRLATTTHHCVFITAGGNINKNLTIHHKMDILYFSWKEEMPFSETCNDDEKVFDTKQLLVFT